MGLAAVWGRDVFARVRSVVVLLASPKACGLVRQCSERAPFLPWVPYSTRVEQLRSVSPPTPRRT